MCSSPSRPSWGSSRPTALLETARDALFLARLSPGELPWIYIVMAVVAVGLAELPGRGRGLPRPQRLSFTLALGSALTLVFFFLRPAGNPWLLRAFYVWAGAIATLAGVQFWVLLGDIYTITQAKRLYRAIGTGSLAGAALGAGLARAGRRLAPGPGPHRPRGRVHGGGRRARLRAGPRGPRGDRRPRPGPLAPRGDQGLPRARALRHAPVRAGPGLVRGRHPRRLRVQERGGAAGGPRTTSPGSSPPSTPS